MKAAWVAVVMVGSAAMAQAGTPRSVESLVGGLKQWKWDDTKKAWQFGNWGTDCGQSVQEATEAGVADTLTVDVDFDTPDFKAGKVTVQQLKATCKHAMHSAKVAGFVRLVLNMTYSPKDDLQADMCVRAWEPSFQGIKLPYEGMSFEDPATGDDFVGTMEAAKAKWCDPLFAARKAALAKEEAPYRKVLKADKLEIALEHRGFYLPGKVQSSDPNKLAKANVWFREIEYRDQSCGNGSNNTHTIIRYQFDAKHKLVKSTDWRRCGPEAKGKFK